MKDSCRSSALKGGVRRPRHEIRSIAEMLLVFVALLVVDTLAGQADRFAAVEPHPFWIPVLLFTAQYGTWAGVASAALAMFGFYAGNLPAIGLDEDSFSYWWRVGQLPLQWFLAGAVLGEIVTRHRHARRRAEREVEEMVEREAFLSKALQNMERLKQRRERELAAVVRSPGRMVSVLARLPDPSRRGYLSSLCELVAVCLSAEQCSIYELEDEGLGVTATYGWWSATEYAAVFGPTSTLFAHVVKKSTPLSVLDPQAASVLGDQGLMAVPIVDPVSERTLGMVKIERLSPSCLTMADLEILRQLGSFIAKLVDLADVALFSTSRDTHRKGNSSIATILSTDQPALRAVSN